MKKFKIIKKLDGCGNEYFMVKYKLSWLPFWKYFQGSSSEGYSVPADYRSLAEAKRRIEIVKSWDTEEIVYMEE